MANSYFEPLSHIAMTSGANNMQYARHRLLACSSHRNSLSTRSTSRFALGPCGIRSAQLVEQHFAAAMAPIEGDQYAHKQTGTSGTCGWRIPKNHAAMGV